jgi:hypothetical protein
MARILKQPDGIATLKPAGHARREQLKARAEALDIQAAEMLKATDGATYAVDPEKLKEEPEILQHMDMHSFMFKVSKPVAGKVYFWERDVPHDHSAVARKQAEARMWLGAEAKGWQVVNEVSDSMPEAMEVLAADNCRRIGDVLLMRIDLDEYTRIQKRILLSVRFRESNIAQKLSDFVRENEGRVSVIEGNADPQTLYAQKTGSSLVKTSTLPQEQ